MSCPGIEIVVPICATLCTTRAHPDLPAKAYPVKRGALRARSLKIIFEWSDEPSAGFPTKGVPNSALSRFRQ
jgi:hypothetical protein